MITYLRVLAYLDAIADAAGPLIDSSPHGRWWKDTTGANLTYAQFMSGTISGSGIASPVPIIDPTTGADKSDSFFFRILLKKDSYKGTPYNQMPHNAQLITDSANDSGTGSDTTAGSAVFNLADGTPITGKQIEDDLREWLKAGAPA
jgi:hypothetical protein